MTGGVAPAHGTSYVQTQPFTPNYPAPALGQAGHGVLPPVGWVPDAQHGQATMVTSRVAVTGITDASYPGQQQQQQQQQQQGGQSVHAAGFGSGSVGDATRAVPGRTSAR